MLKEGQCQWCAEPLPLDLIFLWADISWNKIGVILVLAAFNPSHFDFFHNKGVRLDRVRGGRQKYKRRPEVENATYQSAPLPLTKESEKGRSLAHAVASVLRHNTAEYDVWRIRPNVEFEWWALDVLYKNYIWNRHVLLFKQLNKLPTIKKYDIECPSVFCPAPVRGTWLLWGNPLSAVNQ